MLYNVHKNEQSDIILTYMNPAPLVKDSYISVERNVKKDGLEMDGWPEFIIVGQWNLQKVLQTLKIEVAKLGEEHLAINAA